MSSEETPAPPRAAPLAFWRIAQAFLRILYVLFGAPEDVAARHTITTAAHALMAAWLRAGEALMRRLLLIEAAAHAGSPARMSRRAKRVRVRRPHSFYAEAPQDWRVAFRCFSAPALRHAQHDAENGSAGAGSVSLSPSKATRHPGLRDAWPLAERYEALLRAFNDPAPFARRLAARLKRCRARLPGVLAIDEASTHKIEDFAELDAAARAAWPPPNSS